MVSTIGWGFNAPLGLPRAAAQPQGQKQIHLAVRISHPSLKPTKWFPGLLGFLGDPSPCPEYLLVFSYDYDNVVVIVLGIFWGYTNIFNVFKQACGILK